MQMRDQSTTTKLVCDIKEYKNYENYYVTTDGHVFSTKYKKPKQIKPNNVGKYQTVRLSDGHKTKTIYLHRLVALAFLPKPIKSNHVKHIDGNKENNAMTNLKWYEKRKVKRKPNTPKVKEPLCRNVEFIDDDSIILNVNTSNAIRKIHRASVIKGISKQSNEYDFFHEILELSLNEYINRYGLKKILVNL